MPVNVSTGIWKPWDEVPGSPSPGSYPQGRPYTDGDGNKGVSHVYDSPSATRAVNAERDFGTDDWHSRQGHGSNRLHENAPTPRVSPSDPSDSIDSNPSSVSGQQINAANEVMGPPNGGPPSRQNQTGQVGAFGTNTVNDWGDVASEAGQFGINVGNELVFDAFTRSGQLNNLNGSIGTVLKYPENLGLDPEVTQVIHMDFYYKKSPRMEDVVRKIGDATNTAVSFFEDVKDFAGDVFTDFTQGSPPESMESAAQRALESGIEIPSDLRPGAETEWLAENAPEISWGQMVSDTFADLLRFGNQQMEGEETVRQSTIVEDTRLARAQEKSLDKVSLYLPAGLQIGQQTNYEGYDMNIMRNLMQGKSSLIPGLSKMAAGFVDEAASSIAGINLNAGAAINALTGSIQNPRKEMMFSGTETRSFDFTFQFRPKSREEAMAMIGIIKLLRFHALPEINPSVALLSVPSEVQITFLDYVNTNNAAPRSDISNVGEFLTESPWLPRLGRCAITSVNATFHPESNTVFEDGIPTMADLNITLTELEPIARNHVAELGM